MARELRSLFFSVFALVSLVLIQQLAIPIKSVREDPFLAYHPLSYLTASEIYLKQGRADLAINEWSRLQRNAKKNGDIKTSDSAVVKQQELRIKLAVANAARGNINLATEHLSEVNRLFDERSDQTMRDFALGVSYAQIGKNDEALSFLDRFLQDYPHLTEAQQAEELVSKMREKED